MRLPERAREAIDDAQRLATIVGVGVALMSAAFWAWWGYLWELTPPAIGLVFLAAGTLTLASLYVVLLFASRYFGWPRPASQTVTAPEEINVVAEAKRKVVRAQAGGFLRTVYHGVAGKAVSGLFGQASFVVSTLRSNPENRVYPLLADLLGELWKQANDSIQPLVRAQHCSDDDEMKRYAAAWGELFVRYQLLAHYLNRAYAATGASPWQIPSWQSRYAEWRESDALFLAAMRQAEHMEGCEALVYYLKVTGWGDDDRPTTPSAT